MNKNRLITSILLKRDDTVLPNTTPVIENFGAQCVHISTNIFFLAETLVCLHQSLPHEPVISSLVRFTNPVRNPYSVGGRGRWGGRSYARGVLFCVNLVLPYDDILTFVRPYHRDCILPHAGSSTKNLRFDVCAMVPCSSSQLRHLQYVKAIHPLVVEMLIASRSWCPDKMLDVSILHSLYSEAVCVDQSTTGEQ